jgi:hypothetical protein
LRVFPPGACSVDPAGSEGVEDSDGSADELLLDDESTGAADDEDSEADDDELLLLLEDPHAAIEPSIAQQSPKAINFFLNISSSFS